MVLVTGGSGLLGSRLIVELLRTGVDVLALKRNSTDLKWVKNLLKIEFPDQKDMGNRLQWVDLDFDDTLGLEDVLKQVEAVYHCAALVSFHRRDRDKLYSSNVLAIKNLVNALLSFNREIPMLHVSSTAAIGNNGSDIRRENDLFDPEEENSHYGYTKYLAELEVQRGREEGLKIAIINPSLIIDYGNPGKGSSQMIGQAMKGMPFYAEGGNGIVSALDVAKASILLMKNKKFEGRYLCVGHNLTFKEIQGSLAKSFGKKEPKWVVSPRFLRAIGKLFYPLEYLGLRLPFTLEISRSAGKSATFSNQKLTSEIGYEFEEYGETCNRIASSFKA